MDIRSFNVNEDQYREMLGQEVRIQAVIEALGVPEHARILEVGCGRGVALPVFSRLCKPLRLVGLDIDPGALGQAAVLLQRTSTEAELVVGDVREMPFEDDSFDVVIDFGTCFHIERPDKAVIEIARVLAPGGICIHESELGPTQDEQPVSRAPETAWPTSMIYPPATGSLN